MITATIILGLIALILFVVWLVELIRSFGNWGISGIGFACGVLSMFLGFVWFIFLLNIMRVEYSEQNVSGVVYNARNNEWPLGNTSFSVRASENTYVSEENKSSFCLPSNSPYIKVVNEAAKNKKTKVSVTTEKIFEFVNNPFTCVDNVKVEYLND